MYNAASVIQADPPSAQGVHIVVRFSGSGEMPVQLDYYVQADTLADVRAWARDQVARLNARRTTENAIAGASLPFALDLTPPSPPARPAVETWVAKARRLAALRALGAVTASPLLDEITALADDVRGSYQPGFSSSL
ncbi:MAG: hypothetical protein ACRD3C_22565 [Vicinamibacterales bacterium]